MNKKEANLQQPDEVDSHRRVLTLLGLVGASVAMLGRGSSLLAAEMADTGTAGAKRSP